MIAERLETSGNKADAIIWWHRVAHLGKGVGTLSMEASEHVARLTEELNPVPGIEAGK